MAKSKSKGNAKLKTKEKKLSKQLKSKKLNVNSVKSKKKPLIAKNGNALPPKKEFIKENGKKKPPINKKVNGAPPEEQIINEDDLDNSLDMSDSEEIQFNAEDENSDDADIEHESEDEVEDHKKALDRLKETDPEFYKYLQDNDKKLLNFNLSDDEKEDEDEDIDEDAKLHKPTGDLEIASDESDFEPDDEEHQVDSRTITLKLIKQWQSDIQTDKSKKTIVCLVNAFHAALKRISSENGEQEEEVLYKVDGSAIFNAVIQLCVLELGPAIRRFLGLKSGSKQVAHKCKKFVKVRASLRSYFTDLLKLLSNVTSTNIFNVLLKHLHYMSPLVMSFPNIVKPILKKLVQLWGTSDESVRVVAFLCILRITHQQQQVYLDSILRLMYMTYVKNSKFVSANTLPGINFMRRSLIEMYSLDLNVSYQHVFLFIRQLAINLRNAITINKKENVQAVYNWQFVNSLRLWGSLLAATCNKPQLQPLIYPLVQICLGTIKLVPTVQYYPLRFHIVQILIDLSRDTGVFIPILPFILEILTNYDFNKKNQKVSMKPINFMCIIRLSKSELLENGFKDAVIEAIYGSLLEYLASQSQSIAFPDMALFCKIQLKSFAKKCKVSKYQRKMNVILEKIEQNSTFIKCERKKVNFTLTDFKQIEGWESNIKNGGTPLANFFASWDKVRKIKKSKQATNNEEIGDYKLPTVKKISGKKSQGKNNGPVELFPSDSEDDVEGEGEEVLEKRKRGKRGARKDAKKFKAADLEELGALNGDDVIEDIKISDW